MRVPGNSKLNAGVFGAALAASLLVAQTVSAEVTLVEKDGWTFFADGRVNAFLSGGFGDGFPDAIPPPLDANGNPTRAEYSITGADAGWTGYKATPLEGAQGDYLALRARAGFMGSVFGFGLKRNVTETTTARGYIAVWTTAEASNRDKLATEVTTDVRQGYVSLDGPWGAVTAGRDLGLFGRISTEIDFLYGHNFGLGLPCMDLGGGPTCGHVGTGVIGAGFGAAIVYSTPSVGGLKLAAGLYDPVRLLGGWERVSVLRPEAQLSFETKLGATGMLKAAVEGIYQPLHNTVPGATGPVDVETSVWGVAGGARTEIGPVRLGAAAFRGRGLGFFTALQNDPAMFDLVTRELRTFSGYYGQGALVFGKLQVSLGAGIAMVDQLETDKVDFRLSNAKSQTGISTALYYSVSDNVVVGLDYFRYMVRWYGARNSHFRLDAAGMVVIDPATGAEISDLDPGVVTQEKQDMNFVNAGVTFHW